MRTIVRVHLKDAQGNNDSFITSINLPEQEVHDYYIGKWLNRGVEADRMMKCYMVETLKIEK